jgi:hypothetical protein
LIVGRSARSSVDPADAQLAARNGLHFIGRALGVTAEIDRVDEDDETDRHCRDERYNGEEGDLEPARELHDGGPRSRAR